MLRTDEDLYAAFRDARDERALDELVTRLWPETFRLARAVVREPAAAEDVAQQAFVRVVEAARAGKRLDPFRGWLRTVVVNEARSLLRSEKRRARVEERAVMKTPRESGIAEYVESLPEELRVPIVLHFELGYTHAEVAAALGTPRSTAQSRIDAGLGRLRTSLAEVGVSVAIDELLASRPEGESSLIPAAPRAAQLVARARAPWLTARALLTTRGLTVVALIVMAAVTAAASFGILAAEGAAGATVADRSTGTLGAATAASAATSPALETPPPATSAPDATDAPVVAGSSKAHAVAAVASVCFRHVVMGKVVDTHGMPVANANVSLDTINYDHSLDRYGFPVALERSDPSLAVAREPRRGFGRRSAMRRWWAHDARQLLELGRGVTRADGSYAFEVRVPEDVVHTSWFFFSIESGDDERCQGCCTGGPVLKEDGAPLDLGESVLRPANSIAITVRSGGQPVAGATVDCDLLGNDVGGFDREALPKTTGADGLVEFRFQSIYFDVNLTVSRPGSAIEMRRIHFEDGASIETAFDLVPEVELGGVVKNPATHSPEPGARVSVEEVVPGGDGWGPSLGIPPVETDGSGRFHFRGLRAGSRYRVWASPPERRSDLLGAAKVLVAPCADAEIVLVRPAKIVCETSLANDGTEDPRRSVRDWIDLQLERWDDETLGWRVEAKAEESRGGPFENLPPGRYRVTVHEPSLAPTCSNEIVLSEGEEAKVRVELSRGHRVTGRVVFPSDAAMPRERVGFSVSGRSEWAHLAADGSFELEHVPASDAMLEVSVEGYDAVSVTIPACATQAPEVVLTKKK